jgi:hyaluronoglucosaminidase
MTDTVDFLAGIVEGFYGRSWPLETRLAYAAYLRSTGLNTYLYCPKNDPYLRKHWRDDWPVDAWQNLLTQSSTCKKHGINWGVGLSPFELYRDYRTPQKEQLKRKVERLAQLSAPLLAVLFDDMPGDLDSLATRQAEIVGDICQWLPDVRVLMCPTYYSFDPILQKYFGLMPENYWPQLGRELPVGVDIFWTGNNVCSAAIEVDDIQSILKQLGRPVILWDNYPVNDGAVRSQFLYLQGLSARSTALRPLLTGHLCNPMNQGLLSLPALNGLAALYDGKSLDESALPALLGPMTWERLSRDQRLFQQEGLSGLGRKRRMQLANEYGNLSGAAAIEVAEWLRGEYSFDPACLTD